jgi:hypothetical protein
MRRTREQKEALAKKKTEQLQRLSSERLRRSSVDLLPVSRSSLGFIVAHRTLFFVRKTFAAFRSYVREYMFWVVVDDNNPEELAAYNKFIENNTPNLQGKMSDDDLEFLFRHVNPRPKSIDEDLEEVLE